MSEPLGTGTRKGVSTTQMRKTLCTLQLDPRDVEELMLEFTIFNSLLVPTGCPCATVGYRNNTCATEQWIILCAAITTATSTATATKYDGTTTGSVDRRKVSMRVHLSAFSAPVGVGVLVPNSSQR